MNSQLQTFDKLKADVTIFVQPVFALKVTDKASSASALDAAREIKQYQKKVEELRKSLVGPLNDQVKQINDYAKGIQNPLDKGEDYIKSLLKGFEQKLEAHRQEELKKAMAEKMKQEEELRAKQMAAKSEEEEFASMFKSDADVAREQVTQTVAVEREVHQIDKSHSQAVKAIEAEKVSGAKKVWKFEIQRVEDIPVEYMVPNEVAIRKAMNAGLREIPGVRIFQDTTIAIR